MTLAGSLMFGGWWVWNRLCGEKMTQRMQYRALVIVLLAYVMPWVWIKGIYNAILTASYVQETLIVRRMPVSYADISTEEEAFRTQNYWLLLVIVGIWGIGAAARLLWKCRKYFHEKNEFLLEAKLCRTGEVVETAKRLRKELHCIWMPKIYEAPGIGFTFTVGFIRPAIFLQKGFAADELEPILRHEMTHIARGDLLVKLLLELACCLHWFNPLVFMMKKQLAKSCETSCDEKVVAEQNVDERALYARLVVRSMREGKDPTLLGSALEEDDFMCAEERVNLIMVKRKFSRAEKVLATFVFALILFVDSLTAMAYPDIYHVDADVSVENVNNYSAYKDLEVGVPTDVILYDEQIIDKDGNILPASDASTYGLICTVFGHKDEPCYFESHKKNDDGSCEVKVYNARLCAVCNHIWVESLHSTYTFVTCPH